MGKKFHCTKREPWTPEISDGSDIKEHPQAREVDRKEGSQEGVEIAIIECPYCFQCWERELA